VAPQVRERETAIARIEARLRVPRPAAPDREGLRAALEQRVETWRADLRAEPRVARLVLRRLIGPLELWDESERPEWVRWEAQPLADAYELLDGLVQHVASPTGRERV
jgi:hypothetical protein